MIPLPIVNSAGQTSGDISHSKTGFYWDIKQVCLATALADSGTILVANSIVCSVLLAINEVPVTTQVTALTPITASNTPSIRIGDHDKLSVVVSDAPPNQALFVTYLYDEIQGQV